MVAECKMVRSLLQYQTKEENIFVEWGIVIFYFNSIALKLENPNAFWPHKSSAIQLVPNTDMIFEPLTLPYMVN